MSKVANAVVAMLALSLPAVSMAATWEIDASHSAAHFKVKHLMITDVRGEFSNLSGTVEMDEKDASKSKIEAKIDTTTINTREKKRDDHLKSPDFFEAAKFPAMTFKSKKVESAGKNKLKVTGDLTIKDVTKEVVLAADLSDEQKDPWGNTRRGVTATTTLDRTDFGLKWNQTLEKGGVLVGNEVKVELDLSLVKKTPSKS